VATGARARRRGGGVQHGRDRDERDEDEEEAFREPRKRVYEALPRPVEAAAAAWGRAVAVQHLGARRVGEGGGGEQFGVPRVGDSCHRRKLKSVEMASVLSYPHLQVGLTFTWDDMSVGSVCDSTVCRVLARAAAVYSQGGLDS
jgi:hypothetical protein